MIPESSPKAKDNFDQMLRESTSGEVVAKISEVNAEIDVFDLLRKINIPTLIFHCEEDARVPLNEASILHENIKNSEFVQLESRNHIILKTDPGWSTFVTKLQDFIKKLDVKLH
jgi:pimeloyl-ACP methyl ester carboxylesterase